MFTQLNTKENVIPPSAMSKDVSMFASTNILVPSKTVFSNITKTTSTITYSTTTDAVFSSDSQPTTMVESSPPDDLQCETAKIPRTFKSIPTPFKTIPTPLKMPYFGQKLPALINTKKLKYLVLSLQTDGNFFPRKR